MIKVFDYSPIFNPEVSEIKFDSMKFSAGEVQVKVPNYEDISQPCILADIHSAYDVMELLMVTDALKRSDMCFDNQVELILPYVPYGRQDRVCNEGEALSIKVFCDLINSQEYIQVTILDPHSDVTTALLDRCVVITQEEAVKQMVEATEYRIDESFIPATSNIVLVSPDAGANKKTLKVAKHCGFKGVIRADKVRDVQTGKITDTVVYCDDLGDQDVLIVDDLCDYGGTFVALAKVLRTKTTGKIYLYVSHGILPVGFDALTEVVDHVFVYKYFGEVRPENPNVTIFKCKGEI